MASWSSDDRARHAAIEQVVAGLSNGSPWTAGQSRDFLRSYGELVQADNETWRDQLHRIDELTQPLLHPDTAAQRELLNLRALTFPHGAQRAMTEPQPSAGAVHALVEHLQGRDRGIER